MDTRLIRLPEVMELTGLARSTIYRWIGEGKFPTAIKVSYNVTAWREAEIKDWINQKR